MKSLDLNRKYYNECVLEIIKKHYPQILEKHAAALLGWGSEVLGNDDEYSKIYGWGPRVIIFLRENEYEKNCKKLHEIFAKNLPIEFHGYPTRFTDPSKGPPVPTKNKEGLPQIPITNCKQFINLYLGIESEKILSDSLSSEDWLILNEDKLLRITSGEVYYDGIGDLSKIRNSCEYFPDDIWKYKLAYQWITLSWDIDLIGLCAERNDYFSTEISIMESIKRIIRIIFLLNKHYIPGYLKWLHREFMKLPFLTKELDPILRNILSTKDTDKILNLFYHVIDELVTYQSKILQINIPDYKNPQMLDRGFFTYNLNPIIKSISNQMNGELRRKPFKNGALDQWITDQNILMSPQHLKLFRSIYDSRDPERENLIRMDRNDYFL